MPIGAYLLSANSPPFRGGFFLPCDAALRPRAPTTTEVPVPSDFAGVAPMSAQIVNLSEWRELHPARTPQSRPVRFCIPFLLPGWGWLTPVLCSVTVEW